MTALFARIRSALEQGEETVLCTVVAGSGSIPRGAGAQMLAGRAGLLCGTIGGGSVEGQAISLCREVIERRAGLVRDYWLRQNDTEDIGMVCGGHVTVHFQYIAPQDPAWKKLVQDVLQCFALHRPHTLVLSPDGRLPYLTEPHTSAPDDCFSIPLPIGERAVIFGAGHCSAALSPILQTVGFRVTVMDNRPALADCARFPGADAVICGDYARISDYITLTEADFVVVMTSGHSFDCTVEQQVLRGPYAYLGVIGSHSKTAAVNARLREAGISDASLATVHTPIGTAIKAVTPEEIAVSIAGEMILVRAKRREQGDTSSHSCPMRE